MHMQWYDTEAPKQATHLSVNSDLLRQAKELKINLSRMLESHLASQVQEIKRKQWLESSREAVFEYAAFVDKNGCFGDKLRSF